MTGRLALCLLSLSFLIALSGCSDDVVISNETEGSGSGSVTGEGEASGDGDGEPGTGDGDGEPSTGDGDGDGTTGDGDGEPSTGDGDGDESTGDGDGDESTGDGDGDAGLSFGQDCVQDEDCASGVCWDFSDYDPFCFGAACSAECLTDEACVEAAMAADAPFPEATICGLDGRCDPVGTGLGAFACA